MQLTKPRLSDKTPVTLAEILNAKEQRAEYQEQLLAKYQLPLLSLTITMPGETKLNECVLYLFERAYQQIIAYCQQHQLTCRMHQQKILNTGPEGFFVIEQSELALKQACVEIEQSIPLARLWDIDVISVTSGQPISRKTLGYSPRRCLICDNEAKVCARARTHSIVELTHAIEHLAAQAGYLSIYR
ncbi:citrate lyase holo-[acyl-carrier protein] synthase [Utexia brackfieldae]|uniref:citrate lyase holo-[acyl-carrier protein] synthase n=1 Tax=Utexia brackfieldae TaxID=3074108 RepID=UPI00370D7473